MAGRNSSSVGMMDGAFFVSRTELIAWVNNALQVNLSKVEQCASGAIYCQIIDSVHPGSVAMRKVNWMAKADHEFIPNFKLLQAAFDKNSIRRHIDVDKLIRAKYQDNLEFLQWMKCYWDREGGDAVNYNASQAREGRQLPPWAKAVGDRAEAGLVAPRFSRTVQAAPVRRDSTASQKENTRPCTSKARSIAPVAVATKGEGKTPQKISISSQSTTVNNSAVAELEEADELRSLCATQQTELDEMSDLLTGITGERDFYFHKLRDVEVFCTTLQARMNPELTREEIVSETLGILYAE